MKNLSKVKLQNAVVLENQEMKMILGGSGSGSGSGSTGDKIICGGSGYTHVCACTSTPGTWCGDYGSGGEVVAIDQYCGTGRGSCRPFRN